MPDLILRNIEPTLLDRVKRLADGRGCSLQAVLVALLDRGLACTEDLGDDLDDVDTRVLQEACIALQNLPSDPGFALIGRAAPISPPVEDAPDQAIAAAWTLPK